MSDRPLFDLQGLSEPDAKDYIASLEAHYHQVLAELAKLEFDLTLWNQRVQTAEQSSKPELADQARAQVSHFLTTQAELQNEAEEFREGLEKLKQDLKLLPLTQRNVDPELLLSAFEKLAGPTDQITPLARKAEAEEALAALKERLKQEKNR